MSTPEADRNEELQALRLQLSHLQDTLDHVGAYVFTKDPTGRYTYANQMVCELFGASLDEVVGQTDERFFDLAQSDQLRRNDRRVMDQGEKVENVETNVIAETGETRHYWSVKLPLYDEAGKISGMCGISTDITEQRRLEQQVREQKQLLDSLLDNIDAYVYMKDAERRYLYLNPATAKLFGCQREEAIGRLDTDFFPEEEAARFEALDTQVLQGGKRVAGEETLIDAEGQRRHYWSIKIPLFSGGKVTSYIGISTDITELIELKKELDLANQAKDKLFSIIAHDLRGPLGNLEILFSDVLHEGEVIDAPMLSAISQAASKTKMLLENLLSWSMTQMGRIHAEPAEFDLNWLLRKSLEFFGPDAAKKGIELIGEETQGLVAYADLEITSTVLRNLLSNAIKFCRSGDQIKVGCQGQGEWLEVYIQDTGPGIDQDLLSQLFLETGLARSTKGSDLEQGTGLGLILCKELVQINGGQIGVASEPGQGSRFWVTLPRSSAT